MANNNNNLWNSKWQHFSSPVKLGQGGQGVVWKVKNLTSNETGALKELINFNNNKKNQQRKKRMQIEATSLAVLDHPNICKLLDYNTTSDGPPYIVTEFIEGITLEAKIKQSRFSLDQMQQVAKKLLSALDYAHSIHVFHRDIKPQNILLRNSKLDPVLIDFGISFNEEENLFSSATYTGEQLGNRFLQLPELLRGARDARSDITQVCGVLLYTLTGIKPVDLRDGFGKYPHQVSEVRESLNKSIEDNIAKQKLLRIFDKAFRKKIDDRWQTAIELITAIEKVTMSATNENELYSLDLVREYLESDPNQAKQAITRSLYEQFMQHTRNVINSIIREIDNPLVYQKQGGARQDIENGTFGSHFGITLPKFEVYLGLNGTVIGEEVTMLIEDDETILCRLNADSPDWTEYCDNLKREFTTRLNKRIDG